MANRRMFSLDVVNTDTFLDMPASARDLYFNLGMRADDDGFLASPKRVMRLINSSTDDMRILISKGYVIPFESGVIVIRHWKQNNFIRSDRYHQTRYIAEKQQLQENNGVYELETTGIPTYNQRYTEVRLGKDRLNNNIINNVICPEPETPDKQAAISLMLNDKTEYSVYQEDISGWIKLYPAVDVMQELRKMKGWLDANPNRRKTKRGIKRFINSWLSKEQDKGGSRTINSGSHTITESERAKLEAERIANRPDYMKYLEHREPREDDPFK